MSIQVDVRLEGARQVAEDFRRWSGRAADFSPLFAGKFSKHVTSVFRRQFASEGRFGGEPWPRLQPETLRRRAQAGRGRGGILRDSNRLWGSLVNRNSPEAIEVFSALRYERGTSVPYAGAHQTGRAKGLPQRQVVPEPMPREVVRTWERMLIEWVQEGRA